MKLGIALGLGVLASGFLTSAQALNYTSVAVQQSGFDYDGVVENNAAPGSSPNVYTSVSQALDATSNVFYENGLPGSSGGLPQTNQISVAVGANTFSFDLADYGSGSGLSNNTLQIAPSETNQTLTLATPGSFQSLAFLGFSTEAQSSNAIGSVVITFSDLSTTTFTDALDYPDWYTGSGNPTHVQVYNSMGRVQYTSGLYNQDIQSPLTSASGGNLYACLIELSPTDQLKTVQSVTFSITSSTPSDRSYVMAVAGVVPEPGTASLLALGAAAAVLVRGRKRKTV